MIKKNNLIEKRNVLNELRCNNMQLQELRFFTIYLSKINARDPDNTRVVRFSLSDFLSIMELKKVNISDVKAISNSLLCKVVSINTDSGGFRQFQLFKECTFEKDSDDNWYLEIDANDKALPLMFDFKRDYFTYELWNALRLTSSNQIRMYEILKQYEKVGERTLQLGELKSLLFIGENEYSIFANFRRRVLDSCQKALKQSTDICFDYELIKKSKGKVTDIKFIIKKNTEYIDQLSLEEFINMKKDCIEEQEPEIELEEIEDDQEEDIFKEKLKFYSEALNEEFTLDEVEVLYRLALPIIEAQSDKISFDLKMYNFLALKFSELNSKKNIKFRFNYLKKLIEVDTK